MSIAGELSILGTTKSVQRQHLERLYPYIDWSKMPFSSYDDFFALKNILDDCGAVWTNAYGRSNSEDASTRDILPDYSGNGRDIKLYNFDFTESSGYSGGGLVSDGIDDYGQCIKGFSLPDDYTVVAVRKILNKKGVDSSFAAKSSGSGKGAFLLENGFSDTYSYGQGSSNLAPFPPLFIYQTKTSYCGKTITPGTGTDTEYDILCLFRKRVNQSSDYYKCAFYDLGIFTRTLTDEELRVVKNCMMAEWAAMTGELDNITYVADWDGKDRSNDEEESMRSQWVDKKTGKVIELHNFGYAGMSGWGGCGTDMSKLVPHNDITVTETTYMSLKCTRILKQSNSPISEWGPNRIASGPATVRFRITGVSDNLSIRFESYTIEDGLKTLFTSTGDGVYTAEISDPAKYYRWIAVLPADAVYPVNCNVTIEQLPLYPGALVGDGVDDYGLTQEAINEEVGTMLVYGDYLTTKAQYVLSCGLATEDTWLYATQEDNNGVARIGRPDKTVTDTMPMASLTRDPASPNARMYLFNAGDSNYACAWLSRLILIREQLDAAQVEFLRWKVEKEYRDWLIRMGLYEEEIPWYGIEFDTTDPSPDVKRIGNMEMHRTLPVQSQMRGCLLNDDGTVAKYLDTADWTSETRDGSAGQVMVEMPKDAYWRFETWGTKRRVKFATTALPGFTRTPQGYDSAYEASVQRSASKLCSVVNTDADYRGGNNSSDRDGTYRSQLGLPATAISRTNFRTYARNRNADSSEWNCMTYDFQKLVYWLFAVEYATLNTQKTFNADRDADGLAQGGLGTGVTTVNYNRWHNFNGAYPFIPCGHTDSLGNGTGQIQFTMPFEYDASPSSSTGLGNNYVGEYLSDTAYTSGQFVSQGEDLYECISDTEAGTPLTDTIHFSKVTRTAVQVPRYRGLENPFGHIWQWTDGINVRISPDSDNGGDGLSKVFVTDNPEYFNDSNYDNMSYIGNEARSNGYIKEIIFGEGGEIMPSVVGGSPTTYFCDYHYTNIPTTETLRGGLFGGNADSGAVAGFGCAYSNNAPSNASAYIGSRLCFIPEKA